MERPPDRRTTGAIAPMKCLRYCLGCGYNLAGLATPRCPECGRVFTQDDPATFAAARLSSGWGHVGAGLAALIMVVLGAAASIVEDYYLHDTSWLRCLFPLIPLGLALACAVAVFAGDALKATPRGSPSAQRLARARWLCVAAFMVYLMGDVVARALLSR